jgi:hypothetical protein
MAARGPTRSYASIVAANVFTVFNAILVAFGMLTLCLCVVLYGAVELVFVAPS